MIDKDDTTAEDSVIEDDTHMDTAERFKEDEPPESRRDNPVPRKGLGGGLGLGGAFVLFLLASAAGSAGGFALSRYVMPAASVDMSVMTAPLTTRIDANETALSAQSARLTRLQSRLEALAARPVTDGNGAAADDSGQSRKAEIDAISNEVASLRDDMSAMSASLKAVASNALTRDQVPETPEPETPEPETPEDVPPQESDAQARVTEPNLNAQLSPLIEGRVQSLQSDLTTLKTRVDRLETNLSETRDLAVRPTIIREPVLLPPFPRDAVFEAMTEVPVAPDAGWVSKTLKKHISVRNPEQVKLAERELLAITTAIEDDDIDRALDLVLALPAAPRAAASAWINAAQAGQMGQAQNILNE